MGTITVGRGKYKRIADIYPPPRGVGRIVIPSGIYNEQLILVSDCHANRPNDPDITLDGAGKLIVER